MPPHDFIVDIAKDRKTRDFAEVIRKLGEKLANGTVKLNGVEIHPPPTVHCVLRYERTPHRSYKLKVEMEWHEGKKEEETEADLDNIVS